MKILITGSSGFVGRHLAPLIASSNEVTLLGRRNTSNSPNFIEGTISEKSDNRSALKGVDVVVHCAARAHVMNECSIDPLSAYKEVNTKGTINLAKQAAEKGVKRFIFISSIKVNGESTKHNQAFCYNDIPAPQDDYGVSKAEAEQELRTLGISTGMEIVIIRPPLVYGEGVKANFASLMQLVGKGLPLPFRLLSKNKRSLVSVYNLIDLINVCTYHPKAANEVFLVSDDDDLSTAAMVELMATVQGKTNMALPIPIWFFKLAGKLLNKQKVVERLTGSLQIDIEHTKNTLNWTPPHTVEHGFRRAVHR
ncbi:UDP-glucose 4-epimerase family protein [Pseudoalteromonas piscicida]|uniref:UDP-glucose 4-epimerase family protein n=1 Tax=Pseudoalteromonas piscicida TaxID=43662 RepID=UPI001D0B71D6|nr:SDR family oxidoreductase [Pseudoalteromonas piscicida]